MKKLYFIFLSALISFLSSGQEIQVKKFAIPFDTLSQKFGNPDMLYAPFTFWFWDASLNPLKTAAMADEMSRQGLNPGYSHARNGLPHDEWLSPLWFRSYESALNAAEKNKSYMGYCDEYWWPSGRADNKIIKEHPEFAPVSLEWKIIEVKSGGKIEIPACFFAVAAEVAVTMPDTNYNGLSNVKINSSSLKIISAGKPVIYSATGKKPMRVYVFNKYSHNGYDGGNVNYLDKKLTPTFISYAHKPYQDNVKNKLGKSVKGVFVDNEGDYGWKLAWSDDLEKDYKLKKKRDIRLWMPLMFEEDTEGKWVVARWNWYDVVSDIYSGGFLKPVSDWAESRGMYTISNLWEENIMFQTLTMGNPFQSHRAVTMPGNDCLFSKGLQVHDFKEIQSVTEFDDKRFMSELMGVAGWQMSPVLIKQVTNCIIAWGVSHIVPHGINTNRKLNTIPYPADWFTSNPFWPYFHIWTNYAKRASFINSFGNTDAKVLVLSPLDGIWALTGDKVLDRNYPYFSWNNITSACNHAKKVDLINTIYSSVMNDLTDLRVEFLIADNEYYRNMKITGNTITFKNYNFKSLVLPSVFIVPVDIAEKIVQFVRNGGFLFYFENLPDASVENGLNDKKISEMFSSIKSLPNVIRLNNSIYEQASKQTVLQSDIQFKTSEFSLIQQHRIIDGRDFFWLVNNSGLEQNSNLLFRNQKGLAQKWDCETGSITALGSSENYEGSLLNLILKPYEAYWVVFDKSKKSAGIKNSKLYEYTALNFNGLWKLSIDTTNQPVKVWSRWGAPEEFFNPEGVMKSLTGWTDLKLNRFSGYVDYTNRFSMDFEKGETVILKLGEVKYMAEVYINGKKAGEKLWPPFDFDVTGYLKSGENTIKVKIGNLLCNAIYQFADEKKTPDNEWGWISNKPEVSDFNAGLFGPVTLVKVKQGEFK